MSLTDARDALEETVTARHEGSSLADVRAREEAAIGLLVEHLVRVAADAEGVDYAVLSRTAQGREQQRDLRRRVRAEVWSHVTAPDTDEFVRYTREVGRRDAR